MFRYVVHGSITFNHRQTYIQHTYTHTQTNKWERAVHNSALIELYVAEEICGKTSQ